MEEWKDVKGYEGIYQVSSMGRVKALAKHVRTATGARFLPERIISPIVQHSGYAHVGLWWGGVCKQSRLHRLVAEAFCDNGDPIRKTQVNHINEDKLDNRACNLEWCTPKYNTNFGGCISRRTHGREKGVVCFDKATRATIMTFKSQAEANAWCGVARNNSHISQCCTGRQKTAYGYCWGYAQQAHEGGDMCEV